MLNIVRAWKDAEYRESLSADELEGMPENPVGLLALTDEELGEVAGGNWKWTTILIYVSEASNLCCSVVNALDDNGKSCGAAIIDLGLNDEERVMLADNIDHLIADGMVTQDEIEIMESSLKEAELTPEDIEVMESFRSDFMAHPALSDEQIKVMSAFSSFLRDDRNFEAHEGKSDGSKRE